MANARTTLSVVGSSTLPLPASIQGPKNGQTADGDDVNVGLQGLRNNDAALETGLATKVPLAGGTMTGTLVAPSFEFTLPTSTIGRVGHGTPYACQGAWSINNTGLWTDAQTGSPVNGSQIRIPVDLPHGAILRSVTLYLLPGTHSSLPQHTPAVAFGGVAAASGTAATIAQSGGTDTSMSVTAYDVAHAIALTVGTGGNGYAIDRSSEWYNLLVTSEYGSNFVTGLQILGWLFVYDAPQSLGLD